MKKLLLVAALAMTCAGMTVPRASAQSAFFTFTPTTFTSAAPGSTIQFRIDLNVTTGGTLQNVAGLTYFLQQVGSAPFVFSIVGRATSTGNGAPENSPFRFNQFDDSDFSPASPDPMTDTVPPGGGSNFNDLGRLTQGGGNPNLLPSGTYFVATISLRLATNAAPGSYTVQSVSTGGKRAVFNDSDGETAPIAPASLTITVIPEPSTYALLAFGALGVGALVYRRRASIA